MRRSIMRTTHVGSAVGKIVMAVAVALAIGSISAGPALAAEHERGEERGREERGRAERAREERAREYQWRRGYRPYGYGYGYATPPAVYSPPPPVVYAPPPPPPGFTFVFPIRIR